jgi:hypothetical protein
MLKLRFFFGDLKRWGSNPQRKAFDNEFLVKAVTRQIAFDITSRMFGHL